MAKIVLGRLEQLDLRTTLEKICVVDNVDKIPTDIQENTYVMESTEENLQAIVGTKHQAYIPVTALKMNDLVFDTNVYFDLESYSFYQAAKEIIQKEDKPKGVFRFRRMVQSDNKNELIASDLYVLSSLLGDPEHVQVKQTDHSIIPSHVIIMINFGGGTMAHIEYTFTDQERIEFEWSGVKNIIDFDSETLKPIQPDHPKNLALVYPVDSILAKSHRVDQALIDRLNHFKKLINGGAS